MARPEILLDREARAGGYSAQIQKAKTSSIDRDSFKTRKSFAIPAPGWLL